MLKGKEINNYQVFADNRSVWIHGLDESARFGPAGYEVSAKGGLVTHIGGSYEAFASDVQTFLGVDLPEHREDLEPWFDEPVEPQQDADELPEPDEPEI